MSIERPNRLDEPVFVNDLEEEVAMPDMKTSPLGIAARYNDADVEEHGFKETIEKQGLDFEDLIYIAEQRALRCLWIELGRDLAIFSERHSSGVVLTTEQAKRLVTLQSAELDGMLIGWRARGYKEEYGV